MASLKNIKLKILSYKKTGTVTHAMEAVSAVKMRKSQERALGGRAYAAAALSVLERLSGTADLSRHPLMKTNNGSICFLVITSDKGLAGSLNSGVIRRVERELNERGLSKDNVIIMAIGRRGGDYFLNRGYQVVEKLENVSDDVSEQQVNALTEKIIHLHSANTRRNNRIKLCIRRPTRSNLMPIQCFQFFCRDF
jgi:F-type H+-transporting ATPase subunit gamma